MPAIVIRRLILLLQSTIFLSSTGAVQVGCAPAIDEGDLIEARLDPGSPNKARAYYEEILTELGLKNWTDLPGNDEEALVKLSELQSMQTALAFLGYPDLIPEEFDKNLENSTSPELMARYPGEALASAFFAPKITDVSKGSSTDINLGWRKVVYLKARPDSSASERGIEYGFLLFNKFQGVDRSLDPFAPRADKSNESRTTQLIFLRARGAQLKYPAYFLLYERLSEGGRLKAALDASFDARAPEYQPARPYYVPDACAVCHGAETRPKVYDLEKVQLNVLDTDHWLDRVQQDDDFAFLQDTPFGVLYDGGKDPGTEKFREAFGIIRRMNEAIKKQNEAIGTADSIQLRASTKWWDLHAAGENHETVFERTLGAGESAWQAGRQPDRELLPLLNRFCYRCHSSVRFSVFDRVSVTSKKGFIRFRLNSNDSRFWMPQDRELSEDQKRKLLELVDRLS